MFEGKSDKKRIVWFLLVFVIAGVILQVFLASKKDAVHAQQSVLNRGLVGEPETLDPHNFISHQAGNVLRDIGEGLIAYSSDGELIGGVAESWNVSPDGRTYTFNLRRTAKWSNGDNISSKDFVRAFRELVNPVKAASNVNSLQRILNASEIVRGDAPVEMLGVEAISESSLRIHLHTPTPYFLQLLTHPSTYPVFDTDSDSAIGNFTDKVSNGAYLLANWVVGSELLLKKNDYYWNAENVNFDIVVFHIAAEGTEYNRFRAGELDVTDTVSSSSFISAQENFPNQLKVSPYLGIYYYGFNFENPIFKNSPDLRKALSLAIDREILVEEFTRRGEKPAYGWVPPGTSNYSSYESIDLKFDKTAREQEAQRLYRQAGYGPDNPLRFELRYNVSDVQQRIALAIQSMWVTVLGAEPNLVSEEFKVLLSNIRQRRITDLFRLSWTGEFNDAKTFLQLFESDDPSNMTGYSNTKFDELMKLAGSQSDLAKRRLVLEMAEKLAISDHAVIPLYYYVSKHLVSDRVAGWSPSVLDIHQSQHLRAVKR